MRSRRTSETANVCARLSLPSNCRHISSLSLGADRFHRLMNFQDNSRFWLEAKQSETRSEEARRRCEEEENNLRKLREAEMRMRKSSSDWRERERRRRRRREVGIGKKFGGTLSTLLLLLSTATCYSRGDFTLSSGEFIQEFTTRFVCVLFLVSEILEKSSLCFGAQNDKLELTKANKVFAVHFGLQVQSGGSAVNREDGTRHFQEISAELECSSFCFRRVSLFHREPTKEPTCCRRPLGPQLRLVSGQIETCQMSL